MATKQTKARRGQWTAADQRRLRRVLDRRDRGAAMTREERALVRRYERHRRAEVFREAIASVQQCDLVQSLATSRRSVANWESDGLPVAQQRGPYRFYDLKTVLRWLRERWHADNAAGRTKTEAQIDLLVERRANLVIRNKLLARDYICKTQVESDHREKVSAVQAGLDALVKMAAPPLREMSKHAPLREFEELIAEYVRALLVQFAGESDGGDAGDSMEDGPMRAADGRATPVTPPGAVGDGSGVAVLTPSRPCQPGPGGAIEE